MAITILFEEGKLVLWAILETATHNNTLNDILPLISLNIYSVLITLNDTKSCHLNFFQIYI